MGFDRRRHPILAGNGAQACRSFAIIKPPVERGGQCIGITARNDGAMRRGTQQLGGAIETIRRDDRTIGGKRLDHGSWQAFIM